MKFCCTYKILILYCFNENICRVNYFTFPTVNVAQGMLRVELKELG